MHLQTIDKRRFSLVIFLICAMECLTWAAPVVSVAATHSSHVENRGTALHDYMIRDVKNFGSTVENNFATSRSALAEREEAQKAAEEMVDDRVEEPLTSGKSPLVPSKWTIIGWSIMAFLTFTLGFQEQRTSKLGEVATVAEEDSDDAFGYGPPQGQTNQQNTLPSVSEQITDNMSSNAPTVSRMPCRKSTQAERDISSMSDEEILAFLRKGNMKLHQLEEKLEPTRAVAVRRAFIGSKALDKVPYEGYDYSKVAGKCCENVVGYIQLPLGIAGPLLINGKSYNVPMATTEGALVASTSRGSKAISLCGGTSVTIVDNGITRAPCVRFPSATESASFKTWLAEPKNYAKVEAAFNATSNFGRLVSIHTALAGRNAYVRMKCHAGDAMGMNMVAKGSKAVVEYLKTEFPNMELIAISGNYCTDKKPAAVNWILGRGRSVVADAVITKDVLKSVLKTDAKTMVSVNTQKNLVGSSVAGAVGGNNAHAANIVTAVYLATGQDPAQNVESSNCITLMETTNGGEDLYVSVTMPCVEVGTVGGGTSLPVQAACLELLGCKGASPKGQTGKNADTLAKVVVGSVLAGELSLVAGIAMGHLVSAHLKLNRSKRARL